MAPAGFLPLHPDGGPPRIMHAPINGWPAAEEVLPVRVYAVSRLCSRALLQDSPMLRVVLDEMHADLIERLRADGCRFAGAVDASVNEDLGWPTEDPRGWFRRVLDWLLRRPWIPPPPPYLLRMEIRAA